MQTVTYRYGPRAACARLVVLVGACFVATHSAVLAQKAASAAAPSAPAGVPGATLPEREAQYIAIIEKARSDFTASRSNDARTTVRLGQQISIHRFVGTNPLVQNWVGTFMGSKAAQNGARSILIEIAPGVSLATWDSPYADGPFDTMVQPFQPMAHVLNGLKIGQTVTFSAELIGNVVGNDYEMVMHPRILAKITQLRASDTPP